MRMCACMLSQFSRVQLFATLQTPLSMRFSRQEYLSGLLCPTPGKIPNPGIESSSLMSPALVGRFFTTSAIQESQLMNIVGILNFIFAGSKEVSLLTQHSKIMNHSKSMPTIGISTSSFVNG